MVAFNRAIAIAEIDGPGAALELIDAEAGALDGYHLMHAARGTYLRKLGRIDEARASFQEARDLAPTDPERRFLTDQIDALTADAE